VSPSFNDHPLL